MTHKTKLIEVALPLIALSDQSAREKSIRHGHPFSVHHWWARRPLVSARAVIWASLVDDPSAHAEDFPTEYEQEQERQRLFRILEDLVTWEHSNNAQVLNAARAEIHKSIEGELPVILDPFCGFGTIPIEAQRLGLESVGGELNPVATIVAKAMAEIAPRFRERGPVHPDHAQASLTIKSWDSNQGLAQDVLYYGKRMQEEAFARIGHLYHSVPVPAGKGGGEATVISWIWARTVKSPDPSWGGCVPLVKSWVLRKPKDGPPSVWIEPRPDPSTKSIRYAVQTEGPVPKATVTRANGRCVATGASIPGRYIKSEGAARRISVDLMAVAVEGDRGRVYLSPEEAGLPPSPPPPDGVPSLALSTHSQYMGPPLYGYSTTADLFTSRQLTTLMTFVGLVETIRKEVEQDALRSGLADNGIALRDGGTGARAYSQAVATFLALIIDKMADLGNTFCRWEPVAQCPRQLFGRQAMPMIWDFAEANPFSTSSGSWSVLLRGVVNAFQSVGFPNPRAEASIEQRDARSLEHPGRSALVCTDPPYYDNVPYADLSDFFYVWLRRSLRDIWPNELSTLATPKSEELVADMRRFGDEEAADAAFETGMIKFFNAAVQVHDPRYPLTVFYAFRQSEKREEAIFSTGWETFLQGLLASGLAVIATWPIRTETKGRLRAQSSNALASSIVLACRPRPTDARLATRSEFLTALRSKLPRAVRLLQTENIAPVDLAQSAIGPGMSVFSGFSKVVEADGSQMSVRTALALINEVLQEVLTQEETEFDPDTRFALTWFEQYGMNSGIAGDADVLARAKDTSVSGVIAAEILASRDGRVHLLDRYEMPTDWDPRADRRATVWEATQHLIRRLERSESASAELLRALGPQYGGRARQLAYLLYQISERKGWTKEAVAYNALIVAWPEIVRLAAGETAPVQETLVE